MITQLALWSLCTRLGQNSELLGDVIRLHSRQSFLGLKAYGLLSHRQGYWEGLRRSAWIYLLVARLLMVVAIYEALEMIYLAP